MTTLIWKHRCRDNGRLRKWKVVFKTFQSPSWPFLVVQKATSISVYLATGPNICASIGNAIAGGWMLQMGASYRVALYVSLTFCWKICTLPRTTTWEFTEWIDWLRKEARWMITSCRSCLQMQVDSVMVWQLHESSTIILVYIMKECKSKSLWIFKKVERSIDGSLQGWTRRIQFNVSQLA